MSRKKTTELNVIYLADVRARRRTPEQAEADRLSAGRRAWEREAKRINAEIRAAEKAPSGGREPH